MNVLLVIWHKFKIRWQQEKCCGTCAWMYHTPKMKTLDGWQTLVLVFFLVSKSVISFVITTIKQKSNASTKWVSLQAMCAMLFPCIPTVFSIPSDNFACASGCVRSREALWNLRPLNKEANLWLVLSLVSREARWSRDASRVREPFRHFGSRKRSGPRLWGWRHSCSSGCCAVCWWIPESLGVAGHAELHGPAGLARSRVRWQRVSLALALIPASRHRAPPSAFVLPAVLFPEIKRWREEPRRHQD